MFGYMSQYSGICRNIRVYGVIYRDMVGYTGTRCNIRDMVRYLGISCDASGYDMIPGDITRYEGIHLNS